MGPPIQIRSDVPAGQDHDRERRDPAEQPRGESGDRDGDDEVDGQSRGDHVPLLEDRDDRVRGDDADGQRHEVASGQHDEPRVVDTLGEQAPDGSRVPW
jgi:hypothetical protein